MGEIQEKVWVVMRAESNTDNTQAVKVFDDRRDAREYQSRMQKRSKRYMYWYTGVKKG